MSSASIGSSEGERLELEESSTPGVVETRIYIRRWFILLLFSLLSMSNAMVWVTAAPVSTSFMEYYQIDTLEVNSLSMIYMLVYVIGVYPASWIVDTRGLRTGIMSGALLTAAGTCLRTLPVGGFIPVFIGQTLAAVGQCFILSMPPKISGTWFPDNERSLATSLGAVFNQLGTSLGFVIGPLVVRQHDDVVRILLIHALICTCIMLLNLVAFENKPPLPPSSVQVSESFSLLDLRNLLRKPSFLMLLTICGISIGAFWAVPTVLNEAIYPIGYSELQAGLLGFLFVTVGIFGGILAGMLADFIRQYKFIMVNAIIGIFLSLILYNVSLVPENFTILAIACSLMGFFMSALLPVVLEASVETTFPVPEAISAGIQMLVANFCAIIFVIALSEIPRPAGGTMTTANWILVGLVGVSLLVSLLWRPHHARMEAERIAREASGSSSSSSNSSSNISINNVKPVEEDDYRPIDVKSRYTPLIGPYQGE